MGEEVERVGGIVLVGVARAVGVGRLKRKKPRGDWQKRQCGCGMYIGSSCHLPGARGGLLSSTSEERIEQKLLSRASGPHTPRTPWLAVALGLTSPVARACVLRRCLQESFGAKYQANNPCYTIGEFGIASELRAIATRTYYS